MEWDLERCNLLWWRLIVLMVAKQEVPQCSDFPVRRILRVHHDLWMHVRSRASEKIMKTKWVLPSSLLLASDYASEALMYSKKVMSFFMEFEDCSTMALMCFQICVEKASLIGEIDANMSRTGDRWIESEERRFSPPPFLDLESVVPLFNGF